MAESNFNIIKPVEGLQNIAGITPANRRQERRKKRNNTSDHANEHKDADTVETYQDDVEEDRSILDEKDSSTGGIDYCA